MPATPATYADLPEWCRPGAPVRIIYEAGMREKRTAAATVARITALYVVVTTGAEPPVRLDGTRFRRAGLAAVGDRNTRLVAPDDAEVADINAVTAVRNLRYDLEEVYAARHIGGTGIVARALADRGRHLGQPLPLDEVADALDVLTELANRVAAVRQQIEAAALVRARAADLRAAGRMTQRQLDDAIAEEYTAGVDR